MSGIEKIKGIPTVAGVENGLTIPAHVIIKAMAVGIGDPDINRFTIMDNLGDLLVRAIVEQA